MGLRSISVALGLVALLGCASGADTVMGTPETGGSLALALAAEADGRAGNDAWSQLEAASIRVTSAAAHRAEDGAWIGVGGGLPLQIDLMELLDGGGTVTFPAGAVPEGHYDGVRFTIASATIQEQNGSPITLSRPGGWTVHVDVDADVATGEAIVIKLAVRCDTSFRMAGGEIRFDPVVELVAVQD